MTEEEKQKEFACLITNLIPVVCTLAWVSFRFFVLLKFSLAVPYSNPSYFSDAPNGWLDTLVAAFNFSICFSIGKTKEVKKHSPFNRLIKTCLFLHASYIFITWGLYFTGYNLTYEAWLKRGQPDKHLFF